jgi:hypothetical protein
MARLWPKPLQHTTALFIYRVACHEENRTSCNKSDKLRSVTKHPEGFTAFFYSFKKSTIIKTGCKSLAILFAEKV